MVSLIRHYQTVTTQRRKGNSVYMNGVSDKDIIRQSLLRGGKEIQFIYTVWVRAAEFYSYSFYTQLEQTCCFGLDVGFTVI